jgi:hypothetical protein
MMVSVHMLKTAGMSFAAALERAFGAALLRDYGDNWLDHETVLRAGGEIARNGLPSGVECVHGHFMPVKYLELSRKTPATFITWLRDPVQRLASQYHYARRMYDAATSGPFRRKVVEEGWTLEQFCLCEEQRNYYARVLWQFPVERFDFIGITEHYEADLARFAKRNLGRPLDLVDTNANPDGRTYDLAPSLVARIEQFHRHDVELYRFALKKREAA